MPTLRQSTVSFLTAGLFLINISIAVMMNTPVSFALALVGSLIGIGFRVKIEEAVLSRELGVHLPFPF